MDITNIIESFIISFSSIIVALISAGYFRKVSEYKKKDKFVVRQVEKDQVIHFVLNEIKRKYNSDRVYIIQYHNGGNFYTDLPMQKSTMTYEVASGGLERLSGRYRNILVSHYTWLIKNTIDMKMCYSDTEEIPDVFTRATIQSHGSYAIVTCPIYDKNKNLIAVLGIEWAYSEIPEDYITDGTFNELILKDIKQETESLGIHI